MFRAAKCANQVKWAAASSGVLADDGNVQAPADHFGNFPVGHAFFSDGVVVGSMSGLVQGKLENTCRIEPVHGGPTICAGADEGRSLLLARYLDEYWNEAVVAVAMNRWRQANDRYTPAALYQSASRLL